MIVGTEMQRNKIDDSEEDWGGTQLGSLYDDCVVI